MNTWQIRKGHNNRRRYRINVISSPNIPITSIEGELHARKRTIQKDYDGNIFSRQTSEGGTLTVYKRGRLAWIRWMVLFACFTIVIFQVISEKI